MSNTDLNEKFDSIMDINLDNKRKLDTMLESSEKLFKAIQTNKDYKLYFNYNNLCNCDQIFLIDNHIYFDAVINNTTIDKLIEYIILIINNISLFTTKTIYIHINSKGGYLYDVLKFVEQKHLCNQNHIEVISIIDKESTDCSILLAAICNYRIIRKNAICKFNQYNDNDNYWGIFKHSNTNTNNFYDILKVLFDSIDIKISYDKFCSYFSQNNNWNSKKMKKIGFIDEII